jgi:IS5 family transposase
MHQTKKGNQWSFGMKIHAGVDKDTDLIHSIVTAAVNVHCKVNVLAALTNSVPGAASAACDSMIRGVVCPNEAIHGYKKAKGGIRSP